MSNRGQLNIVLTAECGYVRAIKEESWNSGCEVELS